MRSVVCSFHDSCLSLPSTAALARFQHADDGILDLFGGIACGKEVPKLIRFETDCAAWLLVAPKQRYGAINVELDTFRHPASDDTGNSTTINRC